MRVIAACALYLAFLTCVAPAQALETHPRGQFFYIALTANAKTARFPYDRLLSQYAPDTGWLSGDRQAYAWAYMFLQRDGEIVARVTFTRIPQASYVVVNDRYMYESVDGANRGDPYGYEERLYEGTPGDPDPGTCPAPSESYAPTEDPVGPAPVIVFTDAATGRSLEVRNYANVKQKGTGTTWRFQIMSATADRVTVVAYQSRRPEAVVYYDRLSPSIHLTTNS